MCFVNISLTFSYNIVKYHYVNDLIKCLDCDLFNKHDSNLFTKLQTLYKRFLAMEFLIIYRTLIKCLYKRFVYNFIKCFLITF